MLLQKTRKNSLNGFYENLRNPLQQNYQSDYVPNDKTILFATSFGDLHNDLNLIQLSAVAMVTGENPAIQYPVHMLSKEKLPEDLFTTTDTQRFRVYFTQTPQGLSFEATLPQREFSLFFNLPNYVYQQYFAENKMLDFKMKFIKTIELPIIIQGIRRILKLDLDTEWIKRQRDNNRSM